MYVVQSVVPYLVILAGDTNTSIAFECKIYTLSLAVVNIRVAYDVRGNASGALLRIMICTPFYTYMYHQCPSIQFYPNYTIQYID